MKKPAGKSVFALSAGYCFITMISLRRRVCMVKKAKVHPESPAFIEEILYGKYQTNAAWFYQLLESKQLLIRFNSGNRFGLF